MGGGQELGRVGVRLGHVRVEIPHQAYGVVCEGIVGESACREGGRVNEFDGGDHVGEGACRHASTAGAVGDGEFGAEYDRACVVVQAVAGHGVV